MASLEKHYIRLFANLDFICYIEIMIHSIKGLIPLVIFIAIVSVSWLSGFVFQKWVFSYLHKLSKKTSWKWDDIVVQALNKVIIPWFLIAGIFIAARMVGLPLYITQPLEKILLVIIVISITWLLLKITIDLVQMHMETIAEKLPNTSLLVSFVRWLILIMGGLTLLQVLGISITPVLTTLGIGGLAVALALQDTLKNFFSGIQIIASKQLKPGDFVRLDTGDEGYVMDVTWRNTTIRTISNNTVVIPNAKLADAVITNYYLPQKEIAVRVEVGVSYSSNLEEVEKVTKEVAEKVMNEVAGIDFFEPIIRFHTFGDSSINFTVIMRANEVIDQYLVKHEFIKRLHKRYNEEGIEIPFPISTIYLRKDQE